ncbi:MAG: hypothetical protein ACT4NV_02130 [Rhodoferax sp.]
MSFLNQLKAQAQQVQSTQQAAQQTSQEQIQAVESACQTCWRYLDELARQLNVIGPDGPAYVLLARNPWPSMVLREFRVDARKKRIGDREVFDYIAMGWHAVPRMGQPVGGSVSANFPTDMQRIEERLAAGAVPHERVEVRHPEKNSLQAVRYDYRTEARASVRVTAQHAQGKLEFRLAAVRALELLTTSYAAAQLQTPLLDDLAKYVLGQDSRFL